MADPATPTVDGRRARAERGRLAVVDAMIDLVTEGHTPPSAEQVAERAGVSVATLFCYFDSLAVLQQEMAKRYFERHAHLFVLEDEGSGSLTQRIDRLVRTRAEAFEVIAPLSRLGRSRAVDNPALAADLLASRRGMAEQVRRHFAPELAERTPAEREDLGVLLSSLVSVDAWEHHRVEHGRTAAQTIRAWKRGLATLLTA